MGRIFLLRHGQTVANRDRIIQGPRIDAELSDLGHQQASALGDALADVPIQVVYSSPLVRARQTAASIVNRHRASRAHAVVTHVAPSLLPVQVVPEIYELDYGNLAGRTYDDIQGEMEQVLDAWRLGFVDQSFPGGESAVLAQYRIRPFALRVRDQARQGDVAVVAHGRINRVLMATLTGSGLTTLESYPQSNASITELAVEDAAVRVVRLNDTTHLAATSDSFS